MADYSWLTCGRIIEEDGAEYVVRCRVSGGVTGTRESLLKANGVVQIFQTREAAETEARRLNEARAKDLYRTADFQYWAEVR